MYTYTCVYIYIYITHREISVCMSISSSLSLFLSLHININIQIYIYIYIYDRVLQCQSPPDVVRYEGDDASGTIAPGSRIIIITILIIITVITILIISYTNNNTKDNGNNSRAREARRCCSPVCVVPFPCSRSGHFWIWRSALGLSWTQADSGYCVLETISSFCLCRYINPSHDCTSRIMFSRMFINPSHDYKSLFMSHGCLWLFV